VQRDKEVGTDRHARHSHPQNAAYWAANCLCLGRIYRYSTKVRCFSLAFEVETTRLARESSVVQRHRLCSA